MMIQIELSTETEMQLAVEAEARGMVPEAYAAALLLDAIEARSQPRGRLSVQDLRAMLSEMAEGSEALPKLPSTAFTRESFYRDTF